MKKVLFAAVMFLFVGIAVNASADSITFDLWAGNPGISSYAPPYAEVTVNLTAPNQATITFTGLGTSGLSYGLGSQGAVALNTNGAVTLGTITYTGGGGNTAFSSGGSGPQDGFGNFNFSLNDFDGANAAVHSVTFDLTGSGWSTASNVLLPNSPGNTASAHIFVFGTGLLTVPTGFAANGTTPVPPVPEPATMLLLGSGLIGLAAYGRKKFLKKIN